MLPLKKEMTAAEDLAVYIHWPFCLSKCPYCDFNSHVQERIPQEDWARAYAQELRYYQELTGPRRIVSVFFGGGTPSLMHPATVESVLQNINDLWGIPPETEITLEANPTSVEAEKLRGFRMAGVNRVSLGVQSLRDESLQQLGRQHSAAEAIAAVKTAAGIFDRYSFDLIYARPGQTEAMWRAELAEALALAGEHLSLYQLTIEEGTKFHTLHQRGELLMPDEGCGATLFEMTQEMAAAAGLPAYEISNHARRGAESRHNLVYWRYGDYAGIGPGAHGRLTLNGQKQATRAHRAPDIWLQRVTADGHGAHPFETIPATKMAQEMLLMGLRLRDGIDTAYFHSVAGAPFSLFVNGERAKILLKEGLLVLSDTHLSASAAGRQRLDALLKYLLAE